jgi:hypothetical protein
MSDDFIFTTRCNVVKITHVTWKIEVGVGKLKRAVSTLEYPSSWFGTTINAVGILRDIHLIQFCGQDIATTKHITGGESHIRCDSDRAFVIVSRRSDNGCHGCSMEDAVGITFESFRGRLKHIARTISVDAAGKFWMIGDDATVIDPYSDSRSKIAHFPDRNDTDHIEDPLLA